MKFSDFAERYRVKISVLIAVIIIIISKPNKWSILGGLIFSITGNLLRVWASGYIKKEKEITKSGPYSLTRNPLYLGNLIIGVGFCLASWQIFSIPIFFLYFLIFYIPLIKNEERRMTELFKDDYIQYQKSVPAFFPKLRRVEKTGGFSFKNSLENKEWRAILSTLLYYLAILLKESLIK